MPFLNNLDFAESKGTTILHQSLIPMTITKAHLTASIRKRLGLHRNQSRVLTETLLEIIKRTLAARDDIIISRFGKFRVREKNARNGRNPATGERLMLDSRRIVTFSCSPVLKGKLNGKK